MATGNALTIDHKMIEERLYKISVTFIAGKSNCNMCHQWNVFFLAGSNKPTHLLKKIYVYIYKNRKRSDVVFACTPKVRSCGNLKSSLSLWISEPQAEHGFTPRLWSRSPLKSPLQSGPPGAQKAVSLRLHCERQSNTSWHVINFLCKAAYYLPNYKIPSRFPHTCMSRGWQSELKESFSRQGLGYSLYRTLRSR